MSFLPRDLVVKHLPAHTSGQVMQKAVGGGSRHSLKGNMLEEGLRNILKEQDGTEERARSKEDEARGFPECF